MSIASKLREQKMSRFWEYGINPITGKIEESTENIKVTKERRKKIEN